MGDPAPHVPAAAASRARRRTHAPTPTLPFTTKTTAAFLKSSNPPHDPPCLTPISRKSDAPACSSCNSRARPVVGEQRAPTKTRKSSEKVRSMASCLPPLIRSSRLFQSHVPRSASSVRCPTSTTNGLPPPSVQLRLADRAPQHCTAQHRTSSPITPYNHPDIAAAVADRYLPGLCRQDMAIRLCGRPVLAETLSASGPEDWSSRPHAMGDAASRFASSRARADEETMSRCTPPQPAKDPTQICRSPSLVPAGYVPRPPLASTMLQPTRPP